MAVGAADSQAVGTLRQHQRLWLRAVIMDVAGETTAQLKLKLSYLTYGMAILMALTALALLVLACRSPGRQQTGEL